MHIRAIDLARDKLDHAVAQCEDEWVCFRMGRIEDGCNEPYSPSTDWQIGGPIIEREKITLEWTGENWMAYIRHDEEFFGATPLIAAMRCFVASRLGDTVEISSELHP